MDPFIVSSSSTLAAKPARIALIGCGQITERVYAPILTDLAAEAQVVALCDLDQSRAARLAEARFPGAVAFKDLAALLDGVPLDAVMVLTSERANARTARQVLLKGSLPIFLEKPPASSSAELRDLMSAEAASTGWIYTAFNRRHTPLFHDLDLSASRLLSVSGQLVRLGREVATFPFTGVHLLDSAQYFSRSLFGEMKAAFVQGDVPLWRLTGQLENGAACHLSFVPNGALETEYLILETSEGTWELKFPAIDGLSPQVKLLYEKKDGTREETASPAGASSEIMGYAPCLRHFLHHLQPGDPANARHRLASSLRTIEILDAMQASHQALVSS